LSTVSKEVMDIQEAAEYLGLHPETLRDKARTRALPAAKLGRRWRFRKVELDDWLARGGTLQADGPAPLKA
jgi:excisionase family DNA binding protein